MSEIDKLLTDGLLRGYAGKTKFEEIRRGTFVGQQSALPDGNYIDQWFARELGGGQELVQIPDGIGTRLYAGGHVPTEELEKLGITGEDVLKYHRNKLAQLGERTRLGEKCLPEPDGDWQYEYQILDNIPEIRLRIGLETIFYKGDLVFAHGFLQSPIK